MHRTKLSDAMKKTKPHRARWNIFRRYRRKKDEAMSNYLKRHGRRERYWERVAEKWGDRIRREFPQFVSVSLY